jgi:hypothetical protein
VLALDDCDAQIVLAVPDSKDEVGLATGHDYQLIAGRLHFFS